MSTPSDQEREDTVKEFMRAFKEFGDEYVDAIIADARARAVAERLAEKELGELFDRQLKRLRDLDCPRAIIEIFQGKKKKVISMAMQVNTYEGNIAFLPVVPVRYLGIYALAGMMRKGSEIGFTTLNPNLLADYENLADNLYYILNVEDGAAPLGKSSNDAEEIIKGQGHRCLNAAEVIAVGIHTDVLASHSMFAVNSIYNREYIIVLSNSPLPMLDFVGKGVISENYGTPSCWHQIC